MRFEQTKDVLDHARNFHKQISELCRETLLNLQFLCENFNCLGQFTEPYNFSA